MTMIVDTECEEGKEVPGGGIGGVGGVDGGGVLREGVGNGGGGGRGCSEEGIKLEPGLIWPHRPPPQYLAPKTEIKVILKIYDCALCNPWVPLSSSPELLRAADAEL